MSIPSVLISLLVIVGIKVHADGGICGPTTLPASEPGTLVVTSGILTSETPCKYTINGGTGQFVKIEFQPSKGGAGRSACNKPFVKLEGFTDGVTTEIATLCEPIGDKIYYSPGPQMILTIQGKKGDAAQPFNVSYQSVPSVSEVCGQTTLTAETGVPNQLKAPASPLEVNQICVYKITAQPGEVVELTFETIVEKPATPPLPMKASAPSDTPKTLIRLENFNNGVQTSIANIPPGEKINLKHKSTDGTMIVTLFGLAGLSENPLFTAVYKSVTDPYCGPVVLEAKEQPTKDWKFPLLTHKSARNCTYKIQAAADQTVQLNITALNFDTTAMTKECTAPHLQLENFAEGGNTPIENVCDTKVPRTISSTGPTMIVTLHGADNLKQYAVTATYTAVKVNRCGVVPGEATEEEKSIDVYTENDNIPKTHRCEWTIKAPEDKKMDVYLEIDNDPSDKQCVQVTAPGEKTPKIICRKSDNNSVTSSQPVTVKFLGPGDNVYKNFKIHYKISSANNMIISFVIPLITALLCFWQW